MLDFPLSLRIFIFSLPVTERFPLLVQTSAEEGKQEKKTDQPPQAKKAKVKTKVLDLPIENNPQWQLAIEMLNLFVENEVSLLESLLVDEV